MSDGSIIRTSIFLFDSLYFKKQGLFCFPFLFSMETNRKREGESASGIFFTFEI